MESSPLSGKTVFVSGAARRVGKILALACAQAGADVIIHYRHSEKEAKATREEILSLGRRAWLLSADFNDAVKAFNLMEQVQKISPLYALVNSAAIFETLSFDTTSLEDWRRHLAINLTAPFLLSQAFVRQIPQGGDGRIVNILDWRALRPGTDHFPYTITKAALAAMTRSLAIALAPNITVNGLALGAVLPPADGWVNPEIIKTIPSGRWGQPKELEEALIFLLTGPAYITGEIIHVDGGRHLV